MTILLLALAGGYALVCVAGWDLQERLVFPTFAVPDAGPPPPGAERLSLEWDGVRLEGVRFGARRGAGDTVLLVFPGNGTNAQDLARHLAPMVPDLAVIAFHYRGYPPSTGSPTAADLTADAAAIHDWIVEHERPHGIILYGQSLGSGVAASLAAQRGVKGLVLATPFDSLRLVVGQAYPWLPVGLMFRNEIDSAALLGGRAVPAAIIAAGRDRLVRPERTAGLRPALADLRFDRTLERADHNDILGDPGFPPALRAALEAVRRPRRGGDQRAVAALAAGAAALAGAACGAGEGSTSASSSASSSGGPPRRSPPAPS